MGANELGQTVLEEIEVEWVVEVGVVEPRHGVHVVVGAESINVLLTRGRYGSMEGKGGITGDRSDRHVIYLQVGWEHSVVRVLERCYITYLLLVR